MPAAPATAEAARIEGLLTEQLRKLISAGIPDYGTLTLTASFVEGDVARVELGQSISRKIAPRADRGGRQ